MMSVYRQSANLVVKCFIAYAPRLQDTRNIKRWVAPTLRELQRRRDKIGPEPPQPRSSFAEWNYDAEIYAFGKRLKEEFNKDLLKQALTHRSYVNLHEIKEGKEDHVSEKRVDNWDMINEGNAIISEYIKSFYNEKYPDDIVQALHDYLTSVDMLSHVASHIGLTDIVHTTEFPVNNETLADTFKAVVCALRKSQDLERTHLFIKDFLISQIHEKEIDDIWSPAKPYEYFENLAKQKGLSNIEARLCTESAKHTILASYQVGLYSDKKLVGIGFGESIDLAKQSAALNAIHRIYKISA